MSAILEKLKNIQQELKAPKNQYNKFGNYKYRNAEDILEAVKPPLNENGCVLVLSDEIVNIGNRFYIKAVAKIIDIEDGSFHFSTAFAREEETKKGMDGAQITGASSSYARKYALNGLFLIDDTKDADSTNTHGKDEKKADDSVLAKIKDCKTTKELEKLWGELEPDEQPLYLDKFSTRKAILTAK